MHPQAAETPFLEQFPEDGGLPQRTFIAAVPFSIGRDEATDLHIGSRRVSRRHAVIDRKGETYCIEDLDSTNGTFVNGERVSEAKLQSGDVLAFGDAEFTFTVPQLQPAGCAATQVMDLSAGHGPESSPEEIIDQIRRMHAMLVDRCIQVQFEPVVRLDQGALFGHEAVDSLATTVPRLAADQNRLMQIDCRVTARMRQLQRMIAAEEAAEFSEGTHVFLPVAGSEIGGERLIQSLTDLSHVCPPSKRLVIVIPRENFSDNAYLRKLHERMRDLGMGLALGHCAGGRAAGDGQEGNRPDFVKLAPSLVREIHRTPTRQQQVEAMVRDARNAGYQVIAAGIGSEKESECCRALGCHLGQGRLYHGLAGTCRPAATRA